MKSSIYRWLSIAFGVFAGSMIYQLAQVIGWTWPSILALAVMLSIVFGHLSRDSKETT